MKPAMNESKRIKGNKPLYFCEGLNSFCPLNKAGIFCIVKEEIQL